MAVWEGPEPIILRMDKPDYQLGPDTPLLCGDCGEPVGAGDMANPATGGIVGCNNPECIRNNPKSDKPKP